MKVEDNFVLKLDFSLKMFRRQMFKIFYERPLIRNSYTLSSGAFKGSRRKRMLTKVIGQDKPQTFELSSFQQAELMKKMPELMSELSKMKSFELKTVTTTFFLKVDNS